MKFRFAIVVLAISSLFAATLVSSSQAAGNPNCTEVDGDYIVTFTKGALVSNEVKNINGKQVNPKYLYSEALNGFAGFLTGDQVCNLKKRGNVEDVELDQMAFASELQNGATWGLDRIDQNLLPLNTQYSYVTTGTGVDAYVFDTGILGAHQEFGTRVQPGFTSISDSIGTTDCHGHGTHVAGTIGGSEYGVAKSVSLIPVRVLGCNGSGSISGIISGINWAIGHHVKAKAAVANFSLGGGVSKSLDSAVNNLIKDGVSVVVAAGNERANACNSSPARVPNAITVAASDSTDKLANFSNFGKCVDIIAPGVAIISSIHTSDTAAAAYSGTSMASPHVAGVVARLLSAGAAANSVLTSATTGRFTSLPSGTPNRLLYIDPSK
jgi:subtilisin family serine protease